MKKLACIFPGQGSQSVGMGKDLFDSSEIARQVFRSVDELAGRSLSTLCFEGPESELKRTINTQPTILQVCLAAWQAYAQAGGPQPDFVAGHSLGEFTALSAAGVLSSEATVQLVGTRAQLMESCPPGAMSAVIGMPAAQLEEVCRKVTQESGGERVVIVANFNTREQLVISGAPDAVTAAGAGAKAKGAKVIPLPVGGAFHSPLMQTAADEFSRELDRFSFQSASIAVVQNVDGRPSTDGAQIKTKLARQMSSAVRWCDSVEFMLAQGVDTFIEIGPGKALSGMVKKIDRSARVFNVFDTASLNECLGELRQTSAV